MNLRSIALIGVLTMPAMAQTKTVATPPPVAPAIDVSSLKRELAVQKIKTAIAETNAAASQVANAQNEAEKKKTETIALINKTQGDLGLDSRYEWNFQVGDFTLKANPPKK